MQVRKTGIIFLLHFLSNFCNGQEKTCTEKEKVQQDKIDLESLLTRPDLMLPYQENNGQQVLFIESSGKGYLDARQACAIESAARSGTKANNDLRIIVLINSTTLDVHATNATGQLYNSRKELSIDFYSASNFDEILANTPLDDKVLKQKIRYETKTPIHHVSDALRLVAIYRLGGWYLDIDTVTLKSLDVYKGRNVLSTDQNSQVIKSQRNIIDPTYGIQSVGGSIANGAFHMAKNESLLMWQTMKLARYDPQTNNWSAVGSTPLTSAMRMICGIKPNEFAAHHVTIGGAYSPERCQGYELVDPKYFFPFPWLQANELSESSKTLDEWEEFFSEAFSVDFFRSSMGNTRKVMRPQYYGKRRPAYSYLGPKFCPLSFFFREDFLAK